MTMPYCSSRYKPETGHTIDGRTHAEWHEKAQQIIGKTFSGKVWPDKEYDGELTIKKVNEIMNADFEAVPDNIINTADLNPNRKQVLIDGNGVIVMVTVG